MKQLVQCQGQGLTAHEGHRIRNCDFKTHLSPHVTPTLHWVPKSISFFTNSPNHHPTFPRSAFPHTLTEWSAHLLCPEQNQLTQSTAEGNHVQPGQALPDPLPQHTEPTGKHPSTQSARCGKVEETLSSLSPEEETLHLPAHSPPLTWKRITGKGRTRGSNNELRPPQFHPGPESPAHHTASPLPACMNR